MADKKTAIVTGASRGIGAGVVKAFLNEGYNVVATSRHVSQSLTASPTWFSSMVTSAGRRPVPKLQDSTRSTLSSS